LHHPAKYLLLSLCVYIIKFYCFYQCFYWLR